MSKYIVFGRLIAIVVVLMPVLTTGQARIGTYPPQIHQQICQESTYTRYLDVFNYGDSVLHWNAAWTPGTYDWVTADPLNGDIEPKDSVKVAFHFNSAGMELNNYYAYLQFNSNDPDHPDTVILAMLHVQAITIFIEPENDSICYGCNTTLHTMAFGCSEEYHFSWTSDPPGFTSTEKSPVVTPNVNTTYAVHVTDGGGSAEKSVYIQVYGSSGVEDNLGQRQLAIYPNPARGKFSVAFEDLQVKNLMMRINDLSGRVVYENEINSNGADHLYQVDPGELEKGMYIVTVSNSDDSEGTVILQNKLVVL